MNNRNLLIIFFTLITFFIMGCKSSNTIVNSGELNTKASAKTIIKNIEKNAAQFNTLSAKVKIETLQDSKTQSVSVSMRMEKDKTIWFSKFGLVRAIITPNRVAFYNKLNGTYFDGDFSYISNLLGTELDFNKVQNIILGEPLFKVDEKNYKASTFQKSYLLEPKKQNDLYELFLLINPTYFKADSQQISQPNQLRTLEINYEAYQTIDKNSLPENIRVIAVEKENQLLIKLNIKNIALNNELRFPFTIPSGYKPIELKKK